MSVSMVIPTAGTSPVLVQSLENMAHAARQAGPDADVLVVVNGPVSVSIPDRVGSSPVRVLRLNPPNLSRARNLGIAAARHDTVIFGDDGAEVPSTWCTELADALRDPRYPVVTAPVRVPVSGPVTGFLNYQRIFDAPPLDEVEALTVTGALGIRRDRLPADVRYDEANLPTVGEDAAFGLALRAAGIPIRWLAGAAPARHLLSDRVEEITRRALHYGRGAGRVWCRQLGPVPGPTDILTIYRALTSAESDQFRRFVEVGIPSARAAFALYDYLFSVLWLVGYLDEAGIELGSALIELDQDGLERTVAGIAARASAEASDLGVADWASPRPDFRRLLPKVAERPGHEDASPRDRRPADRPAMADPLVALAQQALRRHVRELPVPPRDPVGARPARTEGAPRRRRADDRLPTLLTAWRALTDSHDGRAAIDADAVDRVVRGAGFGFREGCGVLERGARA